MLKQLSEVAFDVPASEIFMSGTHSLLLVIVAEEAPALGVIGPSFIPVLQKFPGAVDVTRPVRMAWKHTHTHAFGTLATL